MDDWNEILKEDLKKMDKLEQLEEQRLVIENQLQKANNISSLQDKELQTIKEQIVDLRSELPTLLIKDNDIFPRAGRISTIVNQYLKENADLNGNLIIIIDPSEFRTIDEPKIKSATKFTFVPISPGMSKYFIQVGCEFGVIGVVLNPYPEVYEHDYFFTLIELLSSLKRKPLRDTSDQLSPIDALVYDGEFIRYYDMPEYAPPNFLPPFYIRIKI